MIRAIWLFFSKLEAGVERSPRPLIKHGEAHAEADVAAVTGIDDSYGETSIYLTWCVRHIT